MKTDYAEKKRQQRDRLRALGLVRKDVWILPENAEKLRAAEKKWREKVTNTTF